MGVVNTTYTFTGTDTITSSKLNNIIDETTFTSDAISGSSLQIVSPGKLSVAAGGITSNELASNSVTTSKVLDGSITPSKLSTGSPSWTSTVTTTTPGIEVGGSITSSTPSFIDFHSVSPVTDYESRIIRSSGVNGDFETRNTGTGGFIINQIGAGPVAIRTSNTERVRVTPSGDVGIGTNSPSSKLQVAGNVTATSFIGPLTGNVTGIASGNIKQGGGTSQTTNTIYMGWSFGSKLRVQVDTTDFGSTWPIDVSGNSATATTATTVSNGAITAAKLSGAQTGTAAVYGIRAYARIKADGTVDVNKGFSSISRSSTGIYNLTLSATPTSTPAITATCHTESGNNYNLSAAVQINSSTSFTVKTGHEDAPSQNDVDFSIMVIY
jgi:hypothetical protein